MIDVEAARRLLATLEHDVIAARNRADVGDGRELARLVEHAFVSVPAARALVDPGARRELRAIDPALASFLEPYFTAPFAREAAMRAAVSSSTGTINKSTLSIAGMMRAYRSADEAKRKEARGELDRSLDQLYRSTGVQEISESFDAPPAAPPPASKPAAIASSSSLLVLPSAELIQGLAGGGTLDPTMLAALASTSPAAPPPPPSASPEPAASSPPPADHPTAPLRDLLRELAQSILGTAPATFGQWRAACAATHVADFRFGDLGVLRAPSTRPLPFENVAVPLARKGAIVDQDLDAWSSSTHLLGLGFQIAGDAFAGALFASAPSRSFIQRALHDHPNDATRAARAFALSIGFRFFASRLGGTSEELRAQYDDGIKSSPPPSLAAWWSLEAKLANAPGERPALYAHSPALSRAILRGTHLAQTLRDNFDEDWFRNPRFSMDRLRDLALITEESNEARLVAWLREHARL